MSVRSLVVIATAVVALAGMAGTATAQDYPTKPIRFVVAFTPGGGADVSARVVAQRASELIGQQIVIENRPGAGGNIAADMVAKAAPDGYTLLHTTVAHAISRSLYKNLSYDYLRDFIPVAALGSTGFVLVVNPKTPVKTVKEFIEYAKSRKDRQLDYASSGIGGPSHLTAELLKAMTGIEMQHIPYKGVAPAVTDLLAGQIDTTFAVLPNALPLMKNKELRGLGLSTRARSKLAPDLPTIAESGVPGFEAVTWYGALAPTGTPEPIINKLAKVFETVMHEPAIQAKLLGLGFDVDEFTRPEFAAYVKAETEKWAKLVASTNASAN